MFELGILVIYVFTFNYQVLGSWLLVLGIQHLVLNTYYPKPSTAPSTQHPVPNLIFISSFCATLFLLTIQAIHIIMHTSVFLSLHGKFNSEISYADQVSQFAELRRQNGFII